MTDDHGDDHGELADDDRPRDRVSTWPAVVRANNTPRATPGDQIHANQARPHRFDHRR
jgi:hypothetical protein